MTRLLGPDGQEIGTVVTVEEVEGFVNDFDAVLTETEKRYRGVRPPRPSTRAGRHRRENAASKAKKRRRKQSRR
jgi:hypothetical protein